MISGVRDPLPPSSPIPVGLNGVKIFLRGFPGFSPSIRASSETPPHLLFSELNTGEGSLFEEPVVVFLRVLDKGVSLTEGRLGSPGLRISSLQFDNPPQASLVKSDSVPYSK